MAIVLAAYNDYGDWPNANAGNSLFASNSLLALWRWNQKFDIICTKQGHKESLDSPIFIAIAEHIGYNTTGRKTIHKNDCPEIVKQYRQFEQTYRLALRPLGQKLSSDRENKILRIHQCEMEKKIVHEVNKASRSDAIKKL